MKLTPQSGQVTPSPGPRLQGFETLMPFRIREVLLVSSLYDAFILQEDGQISEPILSEYVDLNLRYAPRMRRVSTGLDALEALAAGGKYDLVIATPQLGNIGPLEFAEEVRERFSPTPIALLGYDFLGLEKMLKENPRHAFTSVFVWNGDVRILLAIIKLVEDRVNFLHDSARVGVQGILLIEDSINFLSSYLPMLYTEVLEQSHRVIAEGVNLSHKLLRMRARPKLLLANDYESALRIFDEHHNHLLGVISDVTLPHNGKLDEGAGFDLIRRFRTERPGLPVLMQSSDGANAAKAHEVGASFLSKVSPQLHHDVRRFMLSNFGFGPFQFRMPTGERVARADDIRGLEEVVRTLPAESLRFHADHDHFSTWLRARTEFALADRLAEQKTADFANDEEMRSYLLRSVNEARRDSQRGAVADFNRNTYDGTLAFCRIGSGSLGGKARGLAFVNYLLSYYDPGNAFQDVRVSVPPAIVITTELFDRFMDENDLWDIALGDAPDEAMEKAFLAASLPGALIDDLRGIATLLNCPLAVRSSSILEDSPFQPFAGVYDTFMLSNCAEDVEDRLRELSMAVKRVYASTYSERAKTYIHATPYHHEEEKMAVVIQQLFGRRHGSRYYPTFAGVARSHNYYPHGPVKPEDGVCYVALGLGKTIAEGQGGMRFCPRHPRHLPHFSKVEDVLKNAQRYFYALNHESELDEPSMTPERFPIHESDEDGVLGLVGSVYSPENETISDGVSRPGTRLVSFASVLKHDSFPLAPLIGELLESGSWGMGSPIEIEFCADLEAPFGEPKELAILQMRPLVVSHEQIDVDLDLLDTSTAVCASTRALGNGRIEGIRDIVYVDPERFDRAQSVETAHAVGVFNARLQEQNLPYMLLGPGRWGSSDHWLGIPVDWGHIAGAKVVVETGFEGIKVEPSEGSHFFHNMTSFRVGYLTVNPDGGADHLDLAWLRGQRVVDSGENGLTWVRTDDPLGITIDGRKCHAVITKPSL